MSYFISHLSHIDAFMSSISMSLFLFFIYTTVFVNSILLSLSVFTINQSISQNMIKHHIERKCSTSFAPLPSSSSLSFFLSFPPLSTPSQNSTNPPPPLSYSSLMVMSFIIEQKKKQETPIIFPPTSPTQNTHREY